MQKILNASFTLLLLTLSGYSLSQELIYLPGSEYGKAFPNVPEGYLARNEAYFGIAPNYEPFKDFINNPRYWNIGRSVGMLHILLDSPTQGPVTTVCTATLISGSHIITNHHCIPGSNPNAPVISAKLRMGFHSLAEEGELFEVNVLPLEKSFALDYTVLQVEGTPGLSYGFLELDYREPRAGEPLFMIHHSLGEPKMITRLNCSIISGTNDNSELENVEVPSDYVTENSDTDVRHRCDSLGGSSGSLVFAQLDDQIVGLHFAGTDSDIPVESRFNLFKKFSVVVEQSSFLSALEKPTQDIVDNPNPITVNPNEGFLTVLSEPSGANVYINNDYLGITPIRDYSLAVGDYSLRLALAGYEELNGKFSIVAQELTEGELELIPLTPEPTSASYPQVKQLSVLNGDNAGFFSIAFGPRGRLLAAGDVNSISLWNIEDGELRNKLSGHRNYVWGLAFNPKERALASASDDGTIKLWGYTDNSLPVTLQGHTGGVRAVAFSPSNNNILASSSSDGTIKMWNVSSGKTLATLQGHTNNVWAIAFSPDGKLIASGGLDATVRLWDAKKAQLLETFRGHENSIWAVAFSPNGQTVASGSVDNTVKLWDVHSGQTITTLYGHTDIVNSVEFNPAGNILASASSDATIKLWDVSSGQLIDTLSGHSHWVYDVAFSPNGRLLASASGDGTIRLWGED